MARAFRIAGPAPLSINAIWIYTLLKSSAVYGNEPKDKDLSYSQIGIMIVVQSVADADAFRAAARGRRVHSKTGRPRRGFRRAGAFCPYAVTAASISYHLISLAAIQRKAGAVALVNNGALRLVGCSQRSTVSHSVPPR